MSKVILNLSVQYTDPETLEYRSSLGKEGMFSFESLSKHYLRISSEERLEEDFDRKN